MFDTLFKDAAAAQRKLKLFWIAFFWLVTPAWVELNLLSLWIYDSIFFWEILPEWMFPLLTGFSIFCIANPRSPDFTRIFGGSNGNEGLGLLSICLDWQYISGSMNTSEYCVPGNLNYIQLPIPWQSLWKHNFLTPSVVYCACEHIQDSELISLPSHDQYFQGLSSLQYSTWISGTRRASPSCVSFCPCSSFWA